VPTEAGLALFGVLKRADPALVDPGVTAQLECLQILSEINEISSPLQREAFGSPLPTDAPN
jgi:hypothetical protein